MSEFAIDQAVDLLSVRLREVHVQMRDLAADINEKNRQLKDLTAEAERIREALVPLEASIAARQGTQAPASAEQRISARAYVEQIVEEAFRFWTSAELVDRISQDITTGRVNIQVSNLPGSVRSAIWQLERDNLVLRDGDRIVAGKWFADDVHQWADEELTGDSAEFLGAQLSGDAAETGLPGEDSPPLRAISGG